MKRILIGTILLVIGINSSVFAKTYDLSQISQVKLVTEYSDDTTVDEMDTVTFGSYPQSDVSGNTKEPIEWIVLDRQGDKAFLLSKYVINVKCYNNNEIKSTWAVSSIRNWLNTVFLNTAFNNNEQSIMEFEDLENIDNALGIPGGGKTQDKVFLCSIDEIAEHFGYLLNEGKNGRFMYENKKLATNGTKYAMACTNVIEGYEGLLEDIAAVKGFGDDIYGEEITQEWWHENMKWFLRSPGEDSFRAMYVDVWGGWREPAKNTPAVTTAVHIPHGIRPACWVKINSKFNVDSNMISGLPSRESELRSDNRFYLDNNMQKSTWVYYKTYYYHVDGSGNIQKNQWIELRYVGADGKMYRGRQTPDGKWVGDDGLVVDTGVDLSKSLTIEAAEPDSWYKTQSGLWYYFENDRTTTKKGWFTDKRDNQTYYLDSQTGIMAVGWTKINGSDYYFNESHDNEPNWYETGGGFYESYNKKVKAYGSMFCNEQTPDGKRVDADGKLITNKMEQQTSLNINRNNEISSGKDNRVIPNENFTGLKDGYYYLNGVKLVNKWVEIDGKGYYFNSAGKNYKFNP